MSFDIVVCRFENGEPTRLDMSAALEVLDPYVVARGPRTNFLQVRTAEREEAGVFFSSVPGGPTMIQRDEDRDLLPAALRDEWPVVVVRTGAEIDRAIRAS
ncbi:hypothetical protein ACIPYR_05140 [Streptomyces parvus]|uniref:hypothetical protein n=1 Tax=Streptomyces parvus TaxID=66428 RepID=UPI00380D78A8